MFRLDANPTFWRTAIARIPSATVPDAVDEIAFRVQFEALHDEEARASDAAYAALSDEAKFEQRWHVLKRVVRGWGEVENSAIDLGPFSPETLDRALGWPWIGPAMMAAWRGGLAGEEARLGN